MIRNLGLLMTVCCCFLFVAGNAQDYTADNRLYKTIDWDQFLNKLNNDPSLVFFDIRTPGERGDSSKYNATNQGRIRGAIQTDYANFEKYYPEYLKHKNDTIYLYCSHSMRSRRLSKRLADSAFTKVVNINGGISQLNLHGQKSYPLKNTFYETNNRYKLLSSLDLGSRLKDRNVQVIDIRSDSVYLGISRSEADNHMGIVDGVSHIPAEKLLNEKLQAFDKKRPVILIDNWCDQSPAVANKLIDAGFTDVSVLLFGLGDLIGRVPSTQRRFLKTKYPAILPEELLSLTKKNAVYVIDVRTRAEYAGTDSIPWKNVGRIKGAVNIPLSEFNKAVFERYRQKPVVIYDIMMHDELFEAAKKLREYGFQNLSLLAGGIYLIPWKIANEHKKDLTFLIEK